MSGKRGFAPRGGDCPPPAGDGRGGGDDLGGVPRLPPAVWCSRAGRGGAAGQREPALGSTNATSVVTGRWSEAAYPIICFMVIPLFRCFSGSKGTNFRAGCDVAEVVNFEENANKSQ